MRNLVIFDLDGTLLNTIDDLGTAVNHALSLRELPRHTMEEYVGMVGHGVRNLLTKALPEGKGNLADECLVDFKAYYMEHIDVHTRPYPGISELVKKLSQEGYLLAVASNKFQSGTEKLVSSIFPDIPWIAVFGNRDGFPLKPDPALIEEIRNLAWNTLPEGETLGETILVGDSETDMKTAQNAGIPSIAVTWGFRTKEELVAAGAKNFADTAEEIYKFVAWNTSPKKDMTR